MKKIIILIIVMAAGLYIINEQMESSNRTNKLKEDIGNIVDTLSAQTRKMELENRVLKIQNDLAAGKIKRIKKCTLEEMTNALTKRGDLEFLCRSRDLSAQEKSLYDSIIILTESTPSY
jgi:hypothetical protein